MSFHFLRYLTSDFDAHTLLHRFFWFRRGISTTARRVRQCRLLQMPARTFAAKRDQLLRAPELKKAARMRGISTVTSASMRRA